MSRKPTETAKQKAGAAREETRHEKWDRGEVDLATTMSHEPDTARFKQWLLGTAPIIVHAMSAKARLAMLEKQVGAVQMKQPRDPHQDFEDSLYEMGEGQYGFPVTAIKKAMISVAHVNKGISKEDVLRHLWLRAEIVRVRAALAGAICDVPLIRIWGDRPQMREDPVRIGTGLRRTTTLAFRAEFPRWAMRIEGEFHSPPLRAHQLRYLFEHAGMSSGLGEWRNEKSGVFGSFRMATAEEAAAWDHFAENGGDVPMSDAA